MKIVGASGQVAAHPLYYADAVMTGSAQLVLARSQARCFLMFQNTGSHAMYVEIGSARAHATLTSGAVSSVTVDNAGFNFTKPPVVRFLGGGNAGNSAYAGLGQPGGASPNSSLTAGRPAQARAVLTTGAVTSIVVDDGGAGYVTAPYVLIFNDDLDPNGAAIPSATSGIVLPANMTAPIAFEGTFCPTESISVLGTASDVLLARWSD